MKHTQQQAGGTLPQQLKKGPSMSKPGKQSSFAGGFFVGFLIVLVLVCLFAAALWFDFFELKQRAADFLELEKVQLQTIEKRMLEVGQQEGVLFSREKELEAKQMELDRAQQSLHKLEQELFLEQESLDSLAQRITGQEAELENLVSLYERLPPQQAAEILLLDADPLQTARIMNRIDPTRLSLMLTQLSPKDASVLIGRISGQSIQPLPESNTTPEATPKPAQDSRPASDPKPTSDTSQEPDTKPQPDASPASDASSESDPDPVSDPEPVSVGAPLG